MLKKIKDPVSGLSHLFGVFLSVVGLILLLVKAIRIDSTWHIVSFSVFGICLILLYTASSVYHLLKVSDKYNMILRKIDHVMIFMLIAGTYTPICLVSLRGGWGWSLFGSIWGIAFAGIILKLLWFGAPRWLYTLFYVIMGWLVIIAFFPLLHAVSYQGVMWLVAGGVLYSIGALIYGTKWPRIKSKVFGFHEIFHIFVLLGSICHYLVMYGYVM